jgi:hypothetical protein
MGVAVRKLVKRVQGIRAQINNAKQAAEEIVDQYGDSAMTRVSELEDQALGNKKLLEFFYWKLVREYIRESKKLPKKH